MWTHRQLKHQPAQIRVRISAPDPAPAFCNTPMKGIDDMVTRFALCAGSPDDDIVNYPPKETFPLVSESSDALVVQEEFLDPSVYDGPESERPAFHFEPDFVKTEAIELDPVYHTPLFEDPSFGLYPTKIYQWVNGQLGKISDNN